MTELFTLSDPIWVGDLKILADIRPFVFLAMTESSTNIVHFLIRTQRKFKDAKA